MFFQLTIIPWILVPDARKTFIWHSDFHFLRTFSAKKNFSFFPCLRPLHGGYAPFPKFLDPPLLVTSCDMPAWDTVDLFYPWTLSLHIQHAWDTVDLCYLRAFGRLIRHAWDTVDLCYLRAFGRLIRHAWDTVDLFYLRALSLLMQHAWDTVDLFYLRALSLLMQHAWDTVDLFYLRALSLLMQHTWDPVDLFYPRALSLLIRHAWGTVDLFYLRAQVYFVHKIHVIHQSAFGMLASIHAVPRQRALSVEVFLQSDYDSGRVGFTAGLGSQVAGLNHASNHGRVYHPPARGQPLPYVLLLGPRAVFINSLYKPF